MLYLILAWRNLWRNRRRTLITIASVFGAVFLSILMQSMQHGSYERMIHNVSGFYLGYMQVQEKEYWQEQTVDNSLEASDSLRQAISGVDNIKTVAPRLQAFALAAGESKSRAAMVLGIDPQAEQELMEPQSRLTEGRYFEANDESAVLMGHKLAEYLQLSVGDSVVLLGGGYHGSSAAGKYLIKGLVSYGLPELNSNMVFLPIRTMQDFLLAPHRLTAYALTIDRVNRLDQTGQELQSKLPANLSVLSWQELMPELVQTIEADSAGNVIMLAVLYMVVGFGILGTVLMMSAERKYEFGVLLSIGMQRGRLAITLMLELLFIGLIGVLAGALCAIPIIWYFHENPLELGGEAAKAMEDIGWEPIIPFSTDPALFMTQAITILVLTLIISLYPVLHIYRLDPVHSMRD